MKDHDIPKGQPSSKYGSRQMSDITSDSKPSSSRQMEGNQQSEDLRKSSAGLGPDKDAQGQLSKLMSLMKGQQNVSVTQLAQKLNINVDSQTSMLLNNLKQQLISALSGVPKKLESDMGDQKAGIVNTGHGTQASVSGVGMLPQAVANSVPHVANNQSQGNYRQSGSERGSSSFYSDNRTSVEDQGSDKHAGVKAALAQLLCQQGIGVQMSGSSYESRMSSASSYSPSRGRFSGGAQMKKPTVPDLHSNVDRSFSSSSLESFRREESVSAPDSRSHPESSSRSSQFYSSYRDGGRNSNQMELNQEPHGRRYPEGSFYDSRPKW